MKSILSHSHPIRSALPSAGLVVLRAMPGATAFGAGRTCGGFGRRNSRSAA
jgi:hypothetical protein